MITPPSLLNASARITMTLAMNLRDLRAFSVSSVLSFAALQMKAAKWVH